MADTCEHGMPVRIGCDDCTIGRLTARVAELEALYQANEMLASSRFRRLEQRDLRIKQLEAGLKLIAETDPVDAALDPQRAIRVAAALLSGKERL